MGVYSISWLVTIVFLVGSQTNDTVAGPDQLTVADAKALAEKNQSPKSFIRLDRVTELEVRVAVELAKSKGQLSLGGLTELTPDVAEALATHDGELVLDGIEVLDAETARRLGQSISALSLNKLQPDLAMLTGLAAHQGRLELNGIAILSEEAASVLAAHRGGLGLNGLMSISNEAATQLSGSANDLYLNGIGELSAETQRTLAMHDKLLSLDSLTKLTEESLAAKLSNQDTRVDLSALEETNAECLEILVKNRFGLSLGLRQVSLEQAKILATSTQSLILNRVATMPDDVVEVLADRKSRLTMSGLHELTNPTLARMLATNRPSYIYLPSVKKISAEVARELAQAPCNLVLSGLDQLSCDVATELATHQKNLTLNGIASLDEATAQSLAQHKGKIYMRNLKDVSAESLQLLEGKLVRD